MPVVEYCRTRAVPNDRPPCDQTVRIDTTEVCESVGNGLWVM